MSKTSSRRKPKTVLNDAEPQLFVSNLAASFDYYTQKLGFGIAFSYGDPPFYGQVERDDAKLNLRAVDESPFDPDVRSREQILSASITLDDADALFSEYEASGVDFAQPLRDEPWGARTFIVRDPDGNLILFAS
jgi:uncharacterized glyoxalase superfamily protein PhnB